MNLHVHMVRGFYMVFTVLCFLQFIAPKLDIKIVESKNAI